jgi:hypothetical protein
MILYTFQTLEAWEEAHKIGKFVTDPKKVKAEWSNWPEILKANTYMRSQMLLKNGFKGYPIWTWLKKPDLRSYSSKNTICFSIDIPEDRCLISNFLLYHSVINEDFLALTSSEYDKIDNKEITILDKTKSWQHIFDLDIPKNKVQENWLGTKQQQVYQVCVDEIYTSEIIKIIRWPKLK